MKSSLVNHNFLHSLPPPQWLASLGKRLLRPLIILWVVVLVSCDSATQQPLVEASGTRYLGIEQDSGVQAFLGIPFAEPPVNELRWERPVPIESSLGEVDATHFMPACMQTGSGLAWYHGMMSRVGVDPSLMEGPKYSEDCLYLNVWTTGDRSEPKPVLVFIHGGSNTGGWSYEPNYHGHALAERGLVVVTVAYRLGIFGWLSHPDMAIRNPGLHDLIVALDWINANIGAFGGDPNRIVVSGESAGADNALHLALAPAMANKLAGVIHQSAGWSVTSTLNPEDGFALGEALVAHHLGADGTFDDLKRIPATELLDSQLDVFSGHYFSPIPDPETLPVSLEETVAGDSLPVLNLIIGSNRNESLMYIPEGAELTDYLEGYFPPENWEDIKAMLGADLSELAQMDRLRSALRYTCPSLSLAQAAQEAGGSAYVYRFDRMREGFEAIGAYHGAELPYVFDTHDPWMPTNAIDHQITDALVDYWTAFLTTGSPNESQSGRTETVDPEMGGSEINSAKKGRAMWSAWSQQQQALVIADEISTQTHPDAALCEFLDAARVASARH
ncbi:MAG: carboxylesterase family protein [Pseudomonadota bacterium]|nr:carboxylesterase family protein [Pseudomonadota bacterium]